MDIPYVTVYIKCDVEVGESNKTLPTVRGRKALNVYTPRKTPSHAILKVLRK